jgi:Xaa-Pro aminopeptidase
VTEADTDAELEAGRLERLQGAIADAGCDAGLFYDPTNIRYATGTSNMQVYSLHNPCRYVFVPATGTCTLFEFKGCAHLSDGHSGVGEIRPAISWYDFITGGRTEWFARKWADEIVALLGRGHRDIAVDRLDPIGTREFDRRGIRIHDGQRVANQARMIKTRAEVAVIRDAVVACESGVNDMRAAMQPGITERELWAHLHHANIASGGEWLETRLLTSGHRTNPWYQECSDKVIDNGDLVAFDTDLIGVGGYSVDMSRTWVAGDRAPSPHQRRLHDAAHEQLLHNVELFRPGASFAEIAHAAHLPPPDIHSITNAAVAHGIGLCNEYPLILNRELFCDGGYDGEIEEGMVLCVEALAAPDGGAEAVKLEDQILITATGHERLTTSSLEL